MLEVNKIYNEDCLITMKKIPNSFVDLVITSPPYNMNLRIRNNEYCSRQIARDFNTKYDGYSDNLPIGEFYQLNKYILKELLRISKIIFYNISIVTGSKRAFFKLIGDYSDYLKDIVIWDKNVGQPAMQNNVLNRQSELILIFENDGAISRQFKKCNFNRGTLSDTWIIPRGKKVFSNHGATFPEALVEKILINFSNKDDIIYDPFSGTGTVAVVSNKMKRKYIGSEINLDYFNLSINRLNNIPSKGIFD